MNSLEVQMYVQGIVGIAEPSLLRILVLWEISSVRVGH